MKRSTSLTSISTADELRCVVAHLSPDSPLTHEFVARWESLQRRRKMQIEQKKKWYFTQHEHWLGWLGEQDGPGAYGRRITNRSAEFIYNHINNPKMLIYLAEAAKMPTPRVRRAIAAALRCRKMGEMCRGVRSTLPWSDVEAFLLKRWEVSPHLPKAPD